MKAEINIAPGDIHCSKDDVILTSTPLGSCVAVIIYDKKLRFGGMVHVMLHDNIPRTIDPKDLRYATPAISTLFNRLVKLGSTGDNLEACLIGGANVLIREGDTIGDDNILSIKKYLTKLFIPIRKEQVGGFERRQAMLLNHEGVLLYTEGNSENIILHQF